MRAAIINNKGQETTRQMIGMKIIRYDRYIKTIFSLNAYCFIGCILLYIVSCCMSEATTPSLGRAARRAACGRIISRHASQC